ncbi:class I SAM-dependent methyltransferase [Lichenihabitans psoromatis]|uniref:class I SAM-dependent methyltransferase n=1 Tax=Lichenihabitans psoromatis TaxID=2528642 RepID=UPI001036D273|nr:class I SAM-dependent methyltransferase [Lichenihabitans psoromatis]
MQLEPVAEEQIRNLWLLNKPCYLKLLEITPTEYWNWAYWRGLQFADLTQKASAFLESYKSACKDMVFSHDWFSDKIWIWHEITEPYKNKQPMILEVGVFEGRSVVFCMEYLPGSKVTAVDHFVIKKGFTSTQNITLKMDSEEAFKLNTARYGDRVEVFSEPSWAALTKLVYQGRKYDIIYVDASHTAPDVLADTLIAWRMLKVGGLWIWDDFLLDIEKVGLESVSGGVVTFLKMYEGCYEWVHAGWQVAIRKTSDYGVGMTI